MSLLYTLVLCYLLAGILLFIFQRNLIYFPTPEVNHPYSVETFINDNESIEVIVVNKGQEKAILFFGGNGESVANSAADYGKDFPGYTVYLVNYRGYGGSSGRPQEQALYSDALSVYDQIKIKYTSISVIGRSLGTGVATYLSSKRPIEKMILITPYDSIEHIAQSQYPIYPMSILLKDKFDSLSRVNNMTAPTLILLAEQDKVIPLKNSMRLVHAFPPSLLTVNIIKNTEHNTISNKEEFHHLLSDFMLR